MALSLSMIDLTKQEIPPNQQLVARNKWPIIGEKRPANSDQPWSLTFAGLAENPQQFSLQDIGRMQQTTIRMDIHCVTRWSRQDVRFTGVLLADLLDQVRIRQEAKFLSFVSRSTRNHSSSLSIETALAQQTLIATHVDDEALEVDHGGPIRNIVPGRYFYKSVKWLQEIELLAEDRLGYWEAETGYHNHADPWLEERYMSPTIDRRTALKLIETRDFSGHDLRSINAENRDLAGLKALAALLRDANFRGANLTGADFSDANLANAHLQQANLTGAKLIGTDLEGANLCGADLRHADLSGCSLIGASFSQTLSDGTRQHAVIDSTTVLPEESLSSLTSEQFDFVSARIQIAPQDY